MMLIKNNTPTRASLPAFLIGLSPESLLDLSWTDPALGVQGDAYWPESLEDAPIAPTQKYGVEILTMDAARKIVIVSHEILDKTEQELAAERKALVPAAVEMRQAELALHAAGLLDAVEALVATLPRTAQIEWRRARTVERGYPLIGVMQAETGMSDAQIDQLFIAAALL